MKEKANRWAYSEDNTFSADVPNFEICDSREEAIRLGSKMNLASFWIAPLLPVEQLEPSWPDIDDLIDSACEDTTDEWVAGLNGLNKKELEAKIKPLLDQASKIISDAIFAYNGPLFSFGKPEPIQRDPEVQT